MNGWLARLIGRFAVDKPPIKTKAMLQKGDLIIDISKWNGNIDFKKVKAANVKGIIIKCTEGNSSMDKMFFKNVSGCEAAGVPWGAYHFATWNNEDEELDARTEAKYFLSVVQGAGKPTLPLVLDVESNTPIPYTKAEMASYVAAFLKELQGRETAIYASPSFLNSYFAPDHPFTSVPLWVADYTGNINPVPGWKTFWLRQYSDKGVIPGINGPVDLNSVQ